MSAKLKLTCGPRQASACFVPFRAHRTLVSIPNLFKLDDKQGAPQNSVSMGPPVSPIANTQHLVIGEIHL